MYSLFDNSIGPVILNSLKNSTLSTEFKAMSTEFTLKWDWNALRDIILGNCSTSNNSTSNSTGNDNSTLPDAGSGNESGSGSGLNNGTNESNSTSAVNSTFLNINVDWKEFYDQFLIDGEYGSWAMA